MKKLITLLALVCLMVTGAWANVTSIDKVMEDAIYTLTCSRGALTVSSDKSKLASAKEAGTTFSPLGADYQFQFKKSGDNYYLYSVGAAKYSKNDGTLVDNIGDAAALTLNDWGNGTAQPRWDDNHCLNFGGSSELAIGGWKTGDQGNNFAIAEVEAFPGAGTHYVTLTNKDSSQQPYIYNDKTESTYTLQSANAGATNNYIWKVVSDGAGNITSIVNGDGRGIGVNGQYQGRLTSFQYKNKGGGYYYLTSSDIKAAKNDHECLNRSNGNYSSNGVRTVTTWKDENKNDNQWKIETVDVSALNVYNVVVTGHSDGYATVGSEYAFNGGFFLATSITEDQVGAREIDGYDFNVSVEGATIKVEYTVPTYTFETSQAPIDGVWQIGTKFYSIQQKKEGYLYASELPSITNKTAPTTDDGKWAVIANGSYFQFMNKATKKVLTFADTAEDAKAGTTDNLADSNSLFDVVTYKNRTYTAGYECFKIANTTSYPNDKSGKLAIWASDQALWGWGGSETNPKNGGDDGSKFLFSEVEEVSTMTYTVNVEGAPSAVTVTVKGVTVEDNTVTFSSVVSANDVVATAVPGYFPAAITVGANTINVRYQKWPFETADSFANIQKWYGMNLHYDRTHAPYYDADATPNIQTDGEGYKTEDKYAWGFVMNSDGTVKVYNKAAGSGFSLYSADNNTVCALSDTNSSDFKVSLTGWSTAAQTSGGFCLNVEGQQYINHQDALLKHWKDADAGSTFNVFELDFGTKTYNVHITGAPEGTKMLYGEQPYTDGQTISSVEVTADDITPDTVDGYAYELSIDGTDIYVKYLALPVAGSYIRLQNCSDNKYLTANGAKMNDLESGDNASLKSLWYVKDNGSGALQLMNVATGGFIGNITKSATVTLNTGNTNTFAFEACDGHLVFKPTGGGDYQYGHVNGGDLVGWVKTAPATQWVFTTEEPTLTDYTITVAGLPEGVAGGILYYGQTQSSTLNAPEGLDASLLTAVAVEGDYTPAISISGSAITVKYNRPVTQLSELVQGQTYTITSGGTRGTFTYTANGLSNATTLDPSDPNQQFLFVEYEGSYYLYSVGGDAFINVTGKNENNNRAIACTGSPVNTTLEFLASTHSCKDTNPTVLSIDGHHVGISTGFVPAVITHYNGTGDEGNSLRIMAANTVMTEEQMAAILQKIGFTNVTYVFTNAYNETVNFVDRNVDYGTTASIPANVSYLTDATITEENKEVSTTNKTFHVNGTWNFPIEDGKYYTMWPSNGSNYVSDGTNVFTDNSVEAKAKNHIWTFEHVEGTLDLYKVKNMRDGYATVANSDNQALVTFSTTATEWTSGKGATSYFRITPNNIGFNIQHPGDALANAGNHISGKFGIWNHTSSSTNNGSRNNVAEVEVLNYTVTITGAPEGETPAITYEGNTYETGSTIDNALGIVEADLTVPDYESHVYTLDITGAAITVTYKNYIVELQNKIEALLGPDSKIGKVGYPQSTSTEYAAAIAYSQNFGDGVTNDNYFDANDAYEALIGVEEVVKPEAGHAYKLSLRSLDGTKHWYLTNDGGVSESESDAAIFVMGASEDEDFGAIFVTNNNGDIKYLKSNGTSTDTYAEGYCDFQIAPMVNVSNSYISADNEARFGTFYLKAMRRHDKGSSDNAHGAMILKEENQKWDISGDPYMNGNFSSAIEMEEVEYPYTKPTLVKNEGDAGSFASIWLPFPMLFQEGVEVYKGTTERSADGNSYLGLKRVDTDCVVAAGGYILYSETLTGQIDIQPVAGTPEDQHEDDDAAFVGSTEPDYTMSDLKADHSGTPYVLANKSKGIGFYKYTGTTLPKGKAIWMKEDGSAETVKFSFDDIISAIEALHGNTTNAAIYDLQGHRLDKVQKGQINVINGQKIMFK